MIGRTLTLGATLLAAAAPAASEGLEQAAERSNAGIVLSNASFRGRTALRAVDVAPAGKLDPLILLDVGAFSEGTIEAEIAGLPAAGAAEGSRGFIGLAFHVQPDRARYEAFYIRPTNGRSEDQLRRNHSTQYIAMPDHPWQKLREEQPGVFESYADMAAGEWTRLRIEVAADSARLFVGEATQPTLIVSQLKLGAKSGAVALWIGPGTEGYFRNVRVIRSDQAAR